MRVVPLTLLLALLPAYALTGEETHIRSAGRSAIALKLNNEGADLEIAGDFTKARKCYDEAIRIDPTMWPVYTNRARLNIKEGRYRQAIDDCESALRRKSSFSQSAVLRAAAYAKMGQYDGAVKDLDKVMALGGRGDAYADALNASAWLRATCPDARYRNGTLALRHATMACRLTWDRNPNYLDTLAAANAEVGNFDAAVHAAEMAATRQPTPEVKRKIEQHIVAFKQKRAWREK